VEEHVEQMVLQQVLFLDYADLDGVVAYLDVRGVLVGVPVRFGLPDVEAREGVPDRLHLLLAALGLPHPKLLGGFHQLLGHKEGCVAKDDRTVSVSVSVSVSISTSSS
jgi:hypothetical protein